MEQRRIGGSGLQASVLSLGTMMFGAWGNEDADECIDMVHRALDAGITLFDTADIYDAGVSEEILGRALRGRRDEVVLATKVGNPVGGDPSRSGLSRRWIVQGCEDSLRRLGVDHIDLYQMHRPDPATPIEETLAAFDELVRSGKVGAVGTSTFPVSMLEQAQATATKLGLAAPACEQPPYSVLTRGIETEVLPFCQAHDVGVIVWAPLNGGWLTGKYLSGATDDSRAIRKAEHFDHADAAVREDKLRRVTELAAVAADHGLTLPQLAIAFVLDHPAVTSAIIGPRTLAQLDDLLAAGVQPLPAEARERIDAVVAPGVNVNPANAG
jgi:aryl-alcohol dehydrogenase-like predicted oxidoreductase